MPSLQEDKSALSIHKRLQSTDENNNPLFQVFYSISDLGGRKKLSNKD